MQDFISQLVHYAYGIWRYRWTGMVAAWTVCVLGWTFVFLMPDEYEAKARVQVDTSSVLKPLLKGLAADSDAEDKVTVVTRKMLSRPYLEKVARDTDMDLNVSGPKEMEHLLVSLYNKISISTPYRSTKRNARNDQGSALYFDLTYTDKNPNLAYKVVQILLNTLVNESLGENRSDTSSAQEFLMKQIKDYEEKLRLDEQRLAEFKKQNIGLMPGTKGGYAEQMQSELEELDKLKQAYSLAEKVRDTLKKQLDGESPILGQDPRIVDIDKKIETYRAQLDAYLLKYTDDHPDVQSLKSNISQLEQRRQELVQQQGSHQVADSANSEINPVYQNVKIDLGKIELKVASLQTQIDQKNRDIRQLRKLVDTMPEVEAKLTELNRGYSVTKAQYEALLSRLQSAQLSEDVRMSNFDLEFKIIDPPVVPLIPIGPNRPMLLSVALFVGLGAGLGIMFLMNAIFPVFVTTRELATTIGYPVLGRVEMITDSKLGQSLRINRYLYISALVVLLLFFIALLVYPEKGATLLQALFKFDLSGFNGL